MMKVCFLLVVATVAVLQASGEEKTPTTQGVSNENVTIELLLRRIDQLEQQVSKAEAASHVKQDSSMASKDDLEERLLKKIEELGAKLHFEILNGDRDVKDLLEEKLQDDKDELQGEIKGIQDKLQGEIEGVQGGLVGVQGDITNVQGDIVDMQNANSALCAYQLRVGNGNYGLSGKIVVYDTTYLETNGASCSLDKSTGKFTAGKSGVYQISVSAKNGFTYNDYSFEVYLRTSSGNYQKRKAEIAYQRSSTYYLYTPVNAIRFISLQKGETAWLEYTCSLYRSNFSTAEASMESDSDCYIEDLKFCVSLYK